MAHYDCSNCGDGMGIGYGHCRACTPPEYFALQQELARLRSQAEADWKKAFEEEAAKIEEMRKAFIDAHMVARRKAVEDKLHAVQMETHRAYRVEHERQARTRMIHPVSGREIHIAPGEQIPLFD